MVQPFTPNAAGAAVAIQAAVERVDWDIILQRLAGYAVISGCAVTESSPAAQTIDVAAGIVSLEHLPLATAGGTDIAVTAAHATLDRIDLISIDSGGSVVVTAGTPAAVPEIPTIPAGNVAIADLTVEATVNIHNNDHIRDRRGFKLLNSAQEISGNTTLDKNHSVVNVNTGGGAVIVTLPDADTFQGIRYFIRRDGGSNVTIDVSGADTFSDLTTQKILTTNGEAIGVYSIGDGQWKLVEDGGAGGTDPNAIHDNVAAEISSLTQVAAAAADHVLIEDASDLDNKKRVTAQSIADLASPTGGGLLASADVFWADDYNIKPGNTGAQNDTGMTNLLAALTNGSVTFFDSGIYDFDSAINISGNLLGIKWEGFGYKGRVVNGASLGATFRFNVGTADNLLTFNEDDAGNPVKSGPWFDNIHLTVNTPATQHDIHVGFWMHQTNNYKISRCSASYMLVGFHSESTGANPDNSYWRIDECDTFACTVGFRQRSAGAGQGLLSDCRTFLTSAFLGVTADTIGIDHEDEIGAVVVSNVKVHAATIGYKIGENKGGAPDDGGMFYNCRYEALTNNLNDYTCFQVNGRGATIINPSVNGQSGLTMTAAVHFTTNAVHNFLFAPTLWGTPGSIQVGDTWIKDDSNGTNQWIAAGYPAKFDFQDSTPDDERSGILGIALPTKTTDFSDSDFPHTPPDGTIGGIQTTDDELQFRSGGSWIALGAGGASFQPSHEAISTTSTITQTPLGYVTVTAAVTATLPTSPTAGDTYTVMRKLTSGTPTLASGTSGDFWFNGVTADTYDLESDGALVKFFWDGTHWMVSKIFGVVT
jgi:hypothetical protein